MMRIGTYNVLGLTGYPPEEAEKDLGGPDTEMRQEMEENEKMKGIA